MRPCIAHFLPSALDADKWQTQRGCLPSQMLQQQPTRQLATFNFQLTLYSTAIKNSQQLATYNLQLTTYNNFQLSACNFLSFDFCKLRSRFVLQRSFWNAVPFCSAHFGTPFRFAAQSCVRSLAML